MEPRSIDGAIDTLDEPWSPQTIAAINDHRVKVARLEGSFVWHNHPDSDEVFVVHDGELIVEFRDEPNAHLSAGDLLSVPRGVEHRPVSENGCSVLLIERAGTVNTGDVDAPHRETRTTWLDGIEPREPGDFDTTTS